MYSYIVSKITSPTHNMALVFSSSITVQLVQLSISEELYTNYTIMCFEHLPISRRMHNIFVWNDNDYFE